MSDYGQGVLVNLDKVVQLICGEILDGAFGAREDSGNALSELRSTNVFIADVEDDCLRLQYQLARIREKESDQIYGYSTKEAQVPVDIGWFSVFARGRGKPRGLVPLSHVAEYFGFQRIPVKTAIEGFGEALKSFLRVRAQHSDKKPPGNGSSSPDPMLAFRVHSKEKGGLVHVTRSYYLSYRRAFGSPTTPVDGWLDPGIYSFLVEYPSTAPLIDSGIYHVPPDTQATLLV